MEFEELVKTVGEEPVFETGLLLAGVVNPADVRRQLSRWVTTGKAWQLRRGLYTLAPPFQKVKPHPFVVANHLVRCSYVSMQSALAYYGLIPEYVPLVTSVTAGRPGHWDTMLGSYDFHHIKAGMFLGYKLTLLTAGQEAFVATREKALLDLVYLQVGRDSDGYLTELRLERLDSLNLTELNRLAVLSESLKLKRAAKIISDLAASDKKDYERL
ncbi:MAG: hypothetical protein V2A65_02775 [Candidatus Omnitrophota bacterium]